MALLLAPMLTAGLVSCADDASVSGRTESETAETAPEDDPMLSYYNSRDFWRDEMRDFAHGLGAPSSNYPFVPRQISAEHILDLVTGGDEDFEQEMLEAGQSMIECRDSLRGIGPPPVNPEEGYPDFEDADEYAAYMEACVSYEAAGKLFNRGIADPSVTHVGLKIMK